VDTATEMIRKMIALILLVLIHVEIGYGQMDIQKIIDTALEIGSI